MTAADKMSIVELQRRAAEARSHRRKQTSRNHDRLMVVFWLAIYLPLFGALIFMATN